MQNVILVVHLLACLALIAAVLLQRSEGGALGIGGGGGGGLMSGRGAANVLVRITMVLAAVFFATSLTLTTINSLEARAPSEVERVLEEGAPAPLPGDVGAAPVESAPGQDAPANETPQ